MRRDERVALNDAVVADVIAAPDDDVVADRRERLNRVVFEDEAIVADAALGERRGPTADVGDQLVAASLELVVDSLRGAGSSSDATSGRRR